jgi:AraC-like DNA-binding protein
MLMERNSNIFIFGYSIKKMSFRLHHIVPQLRPFIKMICSMKNDGTTAQEPFRVLPDTIVELFVNCTDKPLANIEGKVHHAQSFLTSRMSSFMDVEMHEASHYVSVCFYPGAAYKFFTVPMHEISNTVAGLDIIWQSKAAEMEDRVLNAITDNDKSIVIQQYLVEELAVRQKHDSEIAVCIREINRAKGQLSIRELCANANISQRQLNRRFQDRVGLAPKEFMRISRFIYSLKHLKTAQQATLTEVAYENGYYDQAHFIHDCREYAGITPGELFTSSRLIIC